MGPEYIDIENSKYFSELYSEDKLTLLKEDLEYFKNDNDSGVKYVETLISELPSDCNPKKIKELEEMIKENKDYLDENENDYNKYKKNNWYNIFSKRQGGTRKLSKTKHIKTKHKRK